METNHIVVVEDSEITIFKLKAILLRLGYSVTTFTNPMTALEWLETPGNLTDLIMTDVMMPEMDGLEFVRKLRSSPATAHTPVIMLTGHTDLEDKIAGLQAGADDYLSKSVSPTELELRLKALLSRSQTAEGTLSQVVAKSISVFGLRGGAGKTTISVNLAIALAQLWGINVSVWDMALSTGHCAALMNMKPTNTLASLHDWPDEPVDDTLLAQFLIKHETGIQLMPAPISPSEAELVTPRTVDLVWSYLQGNSSYLIVDVGSHFTDPVMTILERSDIILLVLTPEILSVKSTLDALEIFTQLGYDLSRVLLVINHIFPAQWLTVKSMATVFKNRPNFEIPYDGDRFIRAIITGEPLIATAPKSEAGLAIISLAYKLSLKHMNSQKKSHSSPLLEWIRKQRI
jgi:pilus assembly protein CpaE